MSELCDYNYIKRRIINIPLKRRFRPLNIHKETTGHSRKFIISCNVFLDPIPGFHFLHSFPGFHFLHFFPGFHFLHSFHFLDPIPRFQFLDSTLEFHFLDSILGFHFPKFLCRVIIFRDFIPGFHFPRSNSRFSFS